MNALLPQHLVRHANVAKFAAAVNVSDLISHASDPLALPTHFALLISTFHLSVPAAQSLSHNLRALPASIAHLINVCLRVIGTFTFAKAFVDNCQE